MRFKTLLPVQVYAYSETMTFQPSDTKSTQQVFIESQYLLYCESHNRYITQDFSLRKIIIILYDTVNTYMQRVDK